MGLSKKRVTDFELGPLWFPAKDSVMSDAIGFHGEWEPSLGSWLKKEILPSITCVNIGANVGYFTCLMSRLVGPAGLIIAIEPRKDLVKLLKLNIKSAALPNVEVHNVAATSSRQTIELWINYRNAGDNRVFDPRRTAGGGSYQDHGFTRIPKKTKVKGRPVDEILNGRTIDFCLIDAQGWEHEIVRGMSNTLSCNLPTMVVEFVPDWIADLGQNPHDVLRAYEDLGYCLSILDSKEGVRAPAEIIRLIEDSEGYFCDLVLRPI